MLARRGKHDETGQEPVFRKSWRWLPWLVLVLALILLTSHSLKLDLIEVDTITLALLGVILVVPLMEYVRRIRIGDFEAEIAPREVARTKAILASQLTQAVQDPDLRNEQLDSVVELTRRDPQLGLAKVRIKLEEAINSLYRTVDSAHPSMPGLARMVDHLTKQEVLPPWLATGVRDVLPLANRAIHGEHVRTADAVAIVSLGVGLIDEIHAVYRERVMKPRVRRTITPQEQDEASRALYELRTIVPLVEDPYEATYVISKDDLDEFLERYDEYAEFIVEVRRAS